MNARRRMITASAAAFVLSGAATLAVSWRMAHVSASESTRMRSYVAPARTLAAGQSLQAADLHLIAWPAVNSVPNAFTTLNDAVGRTTLFPLAPGQPLLESDLSPRAAGPGLAGRIPDGMRALAIRSDEVVGVGGFLSPGLHVDMLVTLQGAGTPQTSTVLQDAVVVAVGQQSEPDPTGKPSTATVVTLLLTPEQVQRALLSGSQGSVHFALRNSADRVSTHTTATTLSDLGASLPRPALLPPASMPALPAALPAEVKAHVTPKVAVVHSGPAMPEVILSGRATTAGSTAEGKR